MFINPFAKTETIIADNKEDLQAYYDAHKDEIFVGYNIRHYDQWIFKAILCDFDPKAVNDHIIVKGQEGWRYSNLLHKIPLIT